MQMEMCRFTRASNGHSNKLVNGPSRRRGGVSCLPGDGEGKVDSKAIENLRAVQAELERQLQAANALSDQAAKLMDDLAVLYDLMRSVEQDLERGSDLQLDDDAAVA